MKSILYFLVTAGCIAQPIVKSPIDETYYVGTVMKIEWDNFYVDTSEINIDLINTWDKDAEPRLPHQIAHGVDVNKKSFEWVIPSWVPSLSHYQIDLWGLKPTGKEGEVCTDSELSDRVRRGLSANFTIINNVQNTYKYLTLVSPSEKDFLFPGKKVFIRWDYPWNKAPFKGFVRVYACPKDESDEYVCKDTNIVSSLGAHILSSKYIEWEIPADLDFEDKKFMISVTSDFRPRLTPALASEFAANSALLEIKAPPPNYIKPKPVEEEPPVKAEGSEENAAINPPAIDPKKLIMDNNMINDDKSIAYFLKPSLYLFAGAILLIKLF